MPGSITINKNNIFINKEVVEEYLIDWIADASDATIPEVSTEDKVIGWVFIGETDPGAPAPTSLYDIVLNNSRGSDVFGGELADRSATVSEQVTPKVGNAYAERLVNSILTVVISGNTENGAVGQFRFFVRA